MYSENIVVIISVIMYSENIVVIFSVIMYSETLPWLGNPSSEFRLVYLLKIIINLLLSVTTKICDGNKPKIKFDVYICQWKESLQFK